MGPLEAAIAVMEVAVVAVAMAMAAPAAQQVVPLLMLSPWQVSAAHTPQRLGNWGRMETRALLRRGVKRYGRGRRCRAIAAADSVSEARRGASETTLRGRAAWGCCFTCRHRGRMAAPSTPSVDSGLLPPRRAIPTGVSWKRGSVLRTWDPPAT